MRIALIGTRGVPARYGGFETAVEEVGKRLARSGHKLTVYARGPRGSFEYGGMEVVRLPAIRSKPAETLVHTSVSIAHTLSRDYDVAIVFNAANALPALALKTKCIPYAVHLDGLEWKRLKWGRAGRRFYLLSERLAARSANGLIADARAIQAYYRQTYDAEAVYIPYGAPGAAAKGSTRIAELDLAPKRYHLLVARLEPENHVDLSVRGFVQSSCEQPLVVVGDAPYAADYVHRVRAEASDDARVRFVGGVWDQDLLDELYANASSYIHGHSVGGTNPSLLRAMGQGAPVLAYDVEFNREVLGAGGRFFRDAGQLAELVSWAENWPREAKEVAERLKLSARERFDWDEVASSYGRLCEELAQGGPRGRIVPELFRSGSA